MSAGSSTIALPHLIQCSAVSSERGPSWARLGPHSEHVHWPRSRKSLNHYLARSKTGGKDIGTLSGHTPLGHTLGTHAPGTRGTLILEAPTLGACAQGTNLENALGARTSARAHIPGAHASLMRSPLETRTCTHVSLARAALHRNWEPPPLQELVGQTCDSRRTRQTHGEHEGDFGRQADRVWRTSGRQSSANSGKFGWSRPELSTSGMVLALTRSQPRLGKIQTETL